MSLLTKQKETHRLRDQRIAKGKDGDGDSFRVWDGLHAAVFKMGSQQGPPV